MRYGKTLERSIYSPWKDKYINYDKLKLLLKEDPSRPGSPSAESAEQDEEWTEDDESKFVEELINVQLEKVAGFQAETLQRLQDETTECEKRLEPLGVKAVVGEEEEEEEESQKKEEESGVSEEVRKKVLGEVLQRLDGITKETNELEKYSRINYTGFLKATKKHDRKRGQSYRVRPLLQVRLAALPFYNEDYSPMLYRLSAMYSFVRQGLVGKAHHGISFDGDQPGGDSYVSYKCMLHYLLTLILLTIYTVWVHPENLLEVKTIILRHLPVLVYNPQTSKIAEGSQPDPSVTSIYFDNPKLNLYTKKTTHEPDAASLRLRWYGSLGDNPDILLEKKVIKEGDISEESRFPIKDKYIKPFLDGSYTMEKQITRLEEKGDENRAKDLRAKAEDIQSFIKNQQLQPTLRANYTRTAFEIPGDDRIRISIDTNLAFIREDAIDYERPCRDPEDWHRRDIDDKGMEYPFSGIRKGEINRFPFAVLELKIKGGRRYEWVSELMASHLVKEAPRFSKFVHGVAELFEDYVNAFPFWLSMVETDIRRDPHKAFEEELERKKKAEEDEVVIGSLFGKSPLGGRGSPFRRGSSFVPGKQTDSPLGSPANKGASYQPSPKFTADMTRVGKSTNGGRTGKESTIEEEASDDDGLQTSTTREPQDLSALDSIRQLFPSWSTSRYAQAHRAAGRSDAALPPGVEVPAYWIKDQGPVRVEAKVWLANQRTFVKWQHVTVLLASLGLGLYNAAGVDNSIARGLAVVYTVVAVFTGVWGWGIYMYRSKLIRTRSGTDFDAIWGPVVVCAGLFFALILNFGFKVYGSDIMYKDCDRGWC
jgi:SPX domain protein involved in polyphosphate accumulation